MGGEPCERIEFSKVARKERSEFRGAFPGFHYGWQHWSLCPISSGLQTALA